MAEENTTNNQEQAADRKEDKDWADAIKVRGGEEVSPAAGDGGDSKSSIRKKLIPFSATRPTKRTKTTK